ncbi:MAG: hypothetical protein ACKOQM_05535 [Novosphingobium sp.]
MLLIIGGVALLALAAPWLWRWWQEAHLADGKTNVYSQDISRPSQELALCLLKRDDDGVALDITSENHFTDTGQEFVVIIERRDSRHVLRAWLPPGRKLTDAEQNRLDNCAAQPVY